MRGYIPSMAFVAFVALSSARPLLPNKAVSTAPLLSSSTSSHYVAPRLIKRGKEDAAAHASRQAARLAQVAEQDEIRSRFQREMRAEQMMLDRLNSQIEQEEADEAAEAAVSSYSGGASSAAAAASLIGSESESQMEARLKTEKEQSEAKVGKAAKRKRQKLFRVATKDRRALLDRFISRHTLVEIMQSRESDAHRKIEEANTLFDHRMSRIAAIGRQCSSTASETASLFAEHTDISWRFHAIAGSVAIPDDVYDRAVRAASKTATKAVQISFAPLLAFDSEHQASILVTDPKGKTPAEIVQVYKSILANNSEMVSLLARASVVHATHYIKVEAKNKLVRALEELKAVVIAAVKVTNLLKAETRKLHDELVIEVESIEQLGINFNAGTQAYIDLARGVSIKLYDALLSFRKMRGRIEWRSEKGWSAITGS